MHYRFWIASLALAFVFMSVCPVEARDLSDSAVRPVSSTSPTTTTTPLVRVWDETLDDWRDGRFIGIELVAVGDTASGDRVERRRRLPRTFWREESPHRTTKFSPRDSCWDACWRILHRSSHSGKLEMAGCIRKTVWANNVSVGDEETIGDLRLWWYFDVDTQAFKLDLASGDYVPYPKRLPSDRSWTGLRFHMPLPLGSLTPRDATHIIRQRGGLVVGRDEACDVVLLPDWADYCSLDRLSRPKEPVRWLRKGVPVVWERSLRVAGDRHVAVTPGAAHAE
jgi:hypothetical protein